jgi:U6 snRNA-associated Sm-like protein LSm7
MAQGKKESAVDLAKFIDKGVRVKLAGGREGRSRDRSRLRDQPRLLTLVVPGAVSGVLKGYDQLLNVVLDEAIEYLRGAP